MQEQILTGIEQQGHSRDTVLLLTPFLSFNTCVVLVSIGIILNRCDSFFDFHQDFPDFLPFPFPVIIDPAFSLLAHTTTSSSNESFI
jgi:hypothetical protein